MEVRDGLLYTEAHEWIRIDGKTAFIGITDYAQDSLGEIVYIDLPETGQAVTRGDEAVCIESAKVAETLCAPLSGTVKEINTALADHPETINENPYGVFLYSLEFSGKADTFMDAAQYKSYTGAQSSSGE